MFLRLYDWGVAHNTAAAGCRWRLEAEMKGDRATRSVALMLSAEVRELAIAGLVHTLFTDRRVPLDWSFDAVRIKLDTPTQSTVASKLMWLRKQVRPSVAKLIEHGHLPAVLDAMGLLDHVTINPNH